MLILNTKCYRIFLRVWMDPPGYECIKESLCVSKSGKFVDWKGGIRNRVNMEEDKLQIKKVTLSEMEERGRDLIIEYKQFDIW